MDVSLNQKFSKNLRESPNELMRFLRRSYPTFVTRRRVKLLQEEVPVFMFHRVEKNLFEEQLEYLYKNGYQTLNIETFMAFISEELQLKENSVLLTFDDGEKSLYQVAYPLLKRYGFHAIAFVVPYYLREQADQTPGKGWLSWHEVMEMNKSGTIDVQSHSYYHARIFIQPTLVDFFHPQFNYNPLGLDIPWIQEVGSYTNQLKLGMPIYRYAARLECYPRYLDDERVREACVSWVEGHGGEGFFSTPSWRGRLNAFYETAIQRNKKNQYETAVEQRQRIFEDLFEAKRILKEKLNKRVQHLCYPWGAGSVLSVSLSKEVGYISNFWCSVDNRRSNKVGDSPFYIPRLKDDYLFRLPGRGRKTLLEIFKMKLQRRMQTMDLY